MHFKWRKNYCPLLYGTKGTHPPIGWPRAGRIAQNGEGALPTGLYFSDSALRPDLGMGKRFTSEMNNHRQESFFDPSHRNARFRFLSISHAFGAVGGAPRQSDQCYKTHFERHYWLEPDGFVRRTVRQAAECNRYGKL